MGSVEYKALSIQMHFSLDATVSRKLGNRMLPRGKRGGSTSVLIDPYSIALL